jgi:uroporphyrinogen decarboxylase
LNHEEPDRVPMDIGSCGPSAIHISAYRSLLGVLGLREEVRMWHSIGQLAAPSETVLQLLGADVRGIRVGGPRGSPRHASPDTLIDQWGTVWRMSENATCYSIVEYPLRHASANDLERYPWPDGRDPHRAVGLAERARSLRGDGKYAVLGEVSGQILERAQMIRGFDTFLEDLGERPAFAEELMDRILEIELHIAGTFLDAVGPYLDIFAFKDDLGTQWGPLISPAMFRKLIKPRMQRLVDAVRARTKAKIWFHSCGSAWFAIPDLIDIGIDVLNPIQVAARHMEPAKLKREFGKHLSFWGAIDTQGVLPFGTPEEVAREVRLRIRELGRGGGYVLASVHNIEADVPGANILAMCQTAQEFGRYPLPD